MAKEETCCRQMGYSFQLAAWVLLYAPSHIQDSTYHSLCYTSRGSLAGTRNHIQVRRQVENVLFNDALYFIYGNMAWVIW